MVKKYLNNLFNEITQISRKLSSGRIKYYGDKEYFANGGEYTVFLKNGKYFSICTGTKFVPKIRKRDILFISKSFTYDLCGNMKDYCGRDFIDSDRGFTRYSKDDRYKNSEYMSSRYKKYKIDYENEINTGCWD